MKNSKQLNAIALDSEKTKDLIYKLNDLLANYQVFYTNVRGYHWNIKGDKFFELHIKFEELYNDLFTKIDDVAERIVTLGGTPDHNYSEYLKISEVQESGVVYDGFEAVNGIIDSFKKILERERTILDMSDEAGDEGTNSLMSDFITEQEKTVWMYSAYVNKTTNS
jgi:starvation-inducible DNA-binding protein